MSPILQKILLIVLMAAVLGYTVFNYINGTTTLVFLGAACIIIGYPLVNFISSLIQDLRKK